MITEKEAEKDLLLVGYKHLPATLMVELADDFRISLFKGYRESSLAQAFPYSASSFKCYKRRGTFIPAELFQQLVKSCQFNDSEINNGIVAIKKRLCGKRVKIKLPLFASENLSELAGHTFGDGHISNGGRFVYVNTCIALVEKVKWLVNEVFGHNIYHDYRKRKDGSIALHYPSAVGEVLAMCGCVKGNKFRQEYDVPRWVKEGNKETKSAFLRALFDDEGTVSDNRIAINMAKQDYIEDSLRIFFNSLIEMLIDLEIRPGNVVICARRKNKNGTNAIGLLFVICGFVELQNFIKNVSFVHPSKQKKLINLVNSFVQPNYHNGEAREIILKKIINPLSTSAISKILVRTTKTTRYHLQLLEKEGKVKKVVHKSKFLWQLEEK